MNSHTVNKSFFKILLITILLSSLMIAQKTDCPKTVKYVGKTYNTVQIGNQCWLKENLDVGTMIKGNQDQTNNNKIEKYCYDNDPNNCKKYGGLYQWNEAMQYTTSEGAQGICPPGWHIPYKYEFEELIEFVKTSGTTKFYSVQSGLYTDGRFRELDKVYYFWTSTGNNSDGSALNVAGNLNGINLQGSRWWAGFSIRCIKN